MHRVCDFSRRPVYWAIGSVLKVLQTILYGELFFRLCRTSHNLQLYGMCAAIKDVITFIRGKRPCGTQRWRFRRGRFLDKCAWARGCLRKFLSGSFGRWHGFVICARGKSIFNYPLPFSRRSGTYEFCCCIAAPLHVLFPFEASGVRLLTHASIYICMPCACLSARRAIDNNSHALLQWWFSGAALT